MSFTLLRTKLEFSQVKALMSLVENMQLKKRYSLAFPFKKGGQNEVMVQTGDIHNLLKLHFTTF